MKIIDIPPGVLAALQAPSPTAERAWPTPDNFAGSLSPVPSFDAEALLPEPLRAFCVSEAHRMQCSIEYVAVTLLASLGSVIGRNVAVMPKARDDWYEYPNLWAACIGQPSQMKSPAMGAALVPLKKLADAANRDFAESERTYLMEQARHKLAVDKAKKESEKSSNSDKLNSYFELLSNPPTPPVHRRYIANDATVEMLGQILRDNPRGVLVVRDELVGLLETFEKPGREGDRSFYLEGWTGKYSFVVDRIGRGTTTIPGLCLAVIGGIQPTLLQTYLDDLRQRANDGLLQRFQLTVFPDQADNLVVVDEPPDKAAADAVDKVFFKLAHTPATGLGASFDDGRDMHYIRFAAGDAQKAFITWLGRHQHRVAAEDAPEVAQHLSKYRKLVPALALIFHLVDVASERTQPGAGIDSWCLVRALRWARLLEAHARRIYAMSGDRALTAAKALSKHIQRGELVDGFTARDVYRHRWSMLQTPQDVENACNELRDAGWIRVIPATTGRTGRPSRRYEINPAVRRASR